MIDLSDAMNHNAPAWLNIGILVKQPPPKNGNMCRGGDQNTLVQSVGYISNSAFF